MFKTGEQIFRRKIAFIEILFKKYVICFRNLLNKLFAVGIGIGFHSFRDVFFFDLTAAIFREDERFHFNKVDNTTEIILKADRKLKHEGSLEEGFFHITYSTKKISTLFIKLAYEGNTRNFIVASKFVYLFGLRFHAGHGRYNEDGAVHGTKGAPGFFEKID